MNVQEIMQQMTLEEKAAFCSGHDFWHTKAIERLGVPAVLILAEPDLGTALVLVPAILVMLLCARVCLRVLIPVLAACLLVAGAVLAAVHVAETTNNPQTKATIYRFLPLKEHQRARLRTFLNPEADPYGGGWNLRQAKISIGSGSLTGKGIGKGEQLCLLGSDRGVLCNRADRIHGARRDDCHDEHGAENREQ